MSREFRIRLYAFILAMGLVFPMLKGLAHAVHEHDSKVCLAQNESHVHSQPTDCDHEHYFNPGGTFNSIDSPEPIEFFFIDSPISGQVCKKQSHPNITLKLRGPPVIHV